MKLRSPWMRALCALLCLLLCPAARAADSSTLRSDFDLNDTLSGLFSCGGALYIQGAAALYRYTPSEGGEPAAFIWDDSLPGERIAFAAGGELRVLALDGEDALLGALSLDGGAARASDLCALSLPEEMDGLRAQGWVASGECLYLLCDNGGAALWAMNLNDLRWARLPFAGPQCIAPAPDGGLYVLESGDALSLWDGQRTSALCAFDVNSASLADLPCALGGLACDPEGGALCAVADNRLRALDPASGALGEPLASLPLSGAARAACILGGAYACIGDSSLHLRALESGAEEGGALTVYDASLLDAASRACLALEGAEVTLTRDASEQERLLENLLTGDARIDVYILYASTSAYAELFSRGYMAELDSPQLLELVSQMYPAVQGAALRDGALVALPVAARRWGLGANLSALSALGLSAADLPETWAEFFDFLSELPALLDGSDVTAFEAGFTAAEVRAQLLQLMLNDFFNDAVEAQGAPEIDTAALQRALEAFEAVDFAALGCAEGGAEAAIGGVAIAEAGGGGGLSYSGPALILLGTGAHFGGFTAGVQPLLLAADAGAPAALALNVALAFVNPHSPNLALAQRYLEALAAELPPESLYSFLPDCVEPVEGERYRARVGELTSEAEALASALSGAAEIDRPALEAALAEANARLEDYRVHGLAISGEQIEWFRAHDARLCVASRDWLFGDGGELRALVQRYLSGQLHIDPFLSALTQKLQMSALEAGSAR